MSEQFGGRIVSRLGKALGSLSRGVNDFITIVAYISCFMKSLLTTLFRFFASHDACAPIRSVTAADMWQCPVPYFSSSA